MIRKKWINVNETVYQISPQNRTFSPFHFEEKSIDSFGGFIK